MNALPVPPRSDLTALRMALPAHLGVRTGAELRATGGGLYPTRVPALDRLLGGGLPKGRLVELIGRRSSGRLALGLALLATATGQGTVAALIDLGDHLDPPTAAAAGVDLTRLLWLRPTAAAPAAAAVEMTLQAGFPVVVFDLGLNGVRLPDAAWVRLARAARAHDAALLLLSPHRVGTGAAVVVGCDAARAVWSETGPRLLRAIQTRLMLLHGRGRDAAPESLRLMLAGQADSNHRAAGG